MSHVAKIPQVKVTDLDALDRAASDLGLTLMRGQRTYKTYSTQKCDHAITNRLDKQMYELGVVKEGDHFNLMQDTFMGGKGMVALMGGHDAPKLQQAYAIQVAAAHYQAEGWNVTETKTEDGWRYIRAQN